LISGVAGGNAAGAALKNTGLTTVVSSLTGLVGGGLGGALLPSILGIASNATGGMDAGALLGNVLSGGVGGALLPW
jgi:hypothetical protein